MATIDQCIQAGRGPGSRSAARRLVSLRRQRQRHRQGCQCGAAGRFLAARGDPGYAGGDFGLALQRHFRAGLTDTGQEIVADVDAKALGHVNATIVAALDKVGGFLNADMTLYLQLTTAGGTAPAGTVHAIIDYDAPPR